MRSLAVLKSYRGHQEYVACQHSRHTSRKGLMDVFLRRRQSGRKLIVWLWNKLTILGVRTVGRLTGAARDVAAHFAVTGWWNWPHQGNHLEAGHRVHELDEHCHVADVTGRGVLCGRCHRVFLPATTAITSGGNLGPTIDHGRRGNSPRVSVPFRPEAPDQATTSSTWRSFSTGRDPPCLKTQAPPFLQVISLQRGPSAQHGVPLLGTQATDILVNLPTHGNSQFDVTLGNFATRIRASSGRPHQQRCPTGIEAITCETTEEP